MYTINIDARRALKVRDVALDAHSPAASRRRAARMAELIRRLDPHASAYMDSRCPPMVFVAGFLPGTGRELNMICVYYPLDDGADNAAGD